MLRSHRGTACDIALLHLSHSTTSHKFKSFVHFYFHLLTRSVARALRLNAGNAEYAEISVFNLRGALLSSWLTRRVCEFVWHRRPNAKLLDLAVRAIKSRVKHMEYGNCRRRRDLIDHMNRLRVCSTHEWERESDRDHTRLKITGSNSAISSRGKEKRVTKLPIVDLIAQS